MTTLSHKRLYLRWRGNIVQSIEVRLADGSICQQVFRSSHAQHNYLALLSALLWILLGVITILFLSSTYHLRPSTHYRV